MDSFADAHKSRALDSFANAHKSRALDSFANAHKSRALHGRGCRALYAGEHIPYGLCTGGGGGVYVCGHTLVGIRLWAYMAAKFNGIKSLNRIVVFTIQHYNTHLFCVNMF